MATTICTVNGEWNGRTCGGAATHPTWKYNPQYELTVSKTGRYRIVLMSVSDVLQSEIGVYLAKSQQGRGRTVLSFDRKSFYAISLFRRHQVSIEVSLTHASEHPCVVVPAVKEPNVGGNYEIRVESLDGDGNANLIPLDMAKWHSVVISSQWDHLSSGGCRRNADWRNNPQFHLLVTERTQINVFLSQEPNESAVATNEPLPWIGFYVMRPHEQQAYVLNGDERMIIRKTRFMSAREVSTCLTLEPSDVPYVILVATLEPQQYARFTVSLFSQNCVQFKEADRACFWQHVSVHGEWTERNEGAAMWESSERYLIECNGDELQIWPLLSQHQSGEDLEYLPMIGLYIVNCRNEKTLVNEEFQGRWEVSGMVPITLNAAESPHYLVPCTQDAGTVSKYKLTVYSNGPVTLKKHAKS